MKPLLCIVMWSSYKDGNLLWRISIERYFTIQYHILKRTAFQSGDIQRLTRTTHGHLKLMWHTVGHFRTSQNYIDGRWNQTLEISDWDGFIPCHSANTWHWNLSSHFFISVPTVFSHIECFNISMSIIPIYAWHVYTHKNWKKNLIIMIYFIWLIQ